MSMLYIILPLALLIATAALIAFVWATRSGQFDDLDTPAMRMLHDDADDDDRALRIDGGDQRSGRKRR